MLLRLRAKKLPELNLLLGSYASKCRINRNNGRSNLKSSLAQHVYALALSKPWRSVLGANLKIAHYR